MSQFTIQPRHWYAMEYLFASGDWHYSPIWVERVEPLQTGRGILRLEFFHANYSEGVQDKGYRLQVVHRDERYLLALRKEEEDDGPVHPVVVMNITPAWMRTRFPQFPVNDSRDFDAELDRITARAGG